MDTKKPWQSKTIVLNFIFTALSTAALFFPQANFVTQFLNAHMVEIGMAWGMLGMLLRFITKDQIQLVD